MLHLLYLDPGSGSYILQLIAATFFAVVFAVKMFWTRLKKLFAKNRNITNEKS